MAIDNTTGLYIHIPFCKSKCLYCNFYSVAGEFDTDIQEKYLNSIIKELYITLEKLENKKTIDTIYIGGGSPSYISYKLYESFFKSLFSIIDSKSIKEFTIELNPNDVDDNIVSLLKNINNIRISLGVQSLDNNILEIINRNTSKDIIISSLDIIDKYNIKKLSLDFIAGLPKSNIVSSKKNVEFLLDRYKNINHISLYYLELDNRVGLIKKWDGMLPDEKDVIEEYDNASMFLKNYSFDRYEISSFSNSIENRSKHNIHYWSLDDYIGLGAGAFGCIDNKRYKNISSIKKYMEGLNKNEIEYESLEYLTMLDREHEFIFLSLRQKSGIDLLKYEYLFGKKFIDKYFDVIEKNINSFDITKSNISIKENKINFSDEITLIFF